MCGDELERLRMQESVRDRYRPIPSQHYALTAQQPSLWEGVVIRRGVVIFVGEPFHDRPSIGPCHSHSVLHAHGRAPKPMGKGDHTLGGLDMTGALPQEVSPPSDVQHNVHTAMLLEPKPDMSTTPPRPRSALQLHGFVFSQVKMCTQHRTQALPPSHNLLPSSAPLEGFLSPF